MSAQKRRDGDVVEIFTDGACSGNPGPGGWGAILVFQGREKEAVLVSLTRSNAEGAVGFLAEVRRMNVALTRARRHLFVVGDSATLAAHPFYAAFIDYAQEVGGYRSVWEWPGADEVVGH